MPDTQFKQTWATFPNNTASVWWRDKGLRTNVFHLTGCCLVVFYLGYDQALLTGLQSVPQWQTYFNHPTGNWLGLIVASLYMGPVVTTWIADWLNTKFGRKLVLYLGSVIVIAGALITTFAQNTGMFIGGRVVLGAGGAISKVVAPCLLQEIAHPRLRAVVGSYYYGTYYVGAILSAWLCVGGLYVKGDWGWRFPCLVQILGPIMVMSILISVPESPRFLVKNGKGDQAHRILAKYHANGDMDDPLVLWEFNEIQVAIELEDVNGNGSYLDFFRTPGNRRRLIAIISLCLGTAWVGNGLVSYYLTPVLNSIGVTKAIQTSSLNAGLQMWSLLIAWLAAANVERFGRRVLFFTSVTGMFFSYAIVMGLSAGFATTKNQTVGVAAVPFLFIYFAFYCIAWTPLPYQYATEICPYNLRTKGLAVFTAVQQGGIAFNQFVNPIALSSIAWKYYAVYLGILLIYAAIIFFYYPETKGLSLEEVGMVFDQGAVRHARRAARAHMEHQLNDHQRQQIDKAQEKAVAEHEHVENISKV